MEEQNQGALPTLDSRYEMIRFLGEGTIGKSYLAKDTLRQQPVVIKIIHDDIVEDAGGFSGLRPKLNTLSNLSHPRIGRMHDFGLLAGQVYLISSLMPGRSLQVWLQERPPNSTPEADLDIIKQIARILTDLQEEHAHGGLKPENVWIDEQGGVSLSDFGLASLANQQKRLGAATLLGRASFIPPEAFQKLRSKQQSTDAFALGMIWRDCLRPQHSCSLAPSIESRLSRLTDSNPEIRVDALSELSTRPSPRTKLQGQRKPIAMFVGLVLALALAPKISQWLSPSPKNNSDQLQASIGDVLTRAQEVNRQRNKLLARLPEASELAPLLLNQIDGRLPLEVLWQAHEATLPSASQSHGPIQLDRRLTSQEQRIQQAASLITDWRHINQLARELSTIHTNLPGADYEALRLELLSDLKSGEILQTVQKAGMLKNQLERIRDEMWNRSYEEALAARTSWRLALATNQLQYIEPIEALSQELEKHRPNTGHHPVAESIPALEFIETRFLQWSHELRSIPLPSPGTQINSIGMRFRSCGPFWASIWETRVLDFAFFVDESGADMRRLWRERAKAHSPFHPVVSVSRNDAADFCRWLTKKDQKSNKIDPSQYYRLPTDLEWSLMAGLSEPDDGRKPYERGFDFPNHYPWGSLEIARARRGNYFTPWNAAAESPHPQHDPFPETAPVGQFAPNEFGLYDIGGNVWEWVGDGMYEPTPNIVRRNGATRGGGWRSFDLDEMRTATRRMHSQDHEELGFRVILVEKEPRTASGKEGSLD